MAVKVRIPAFKTQVRRIVSKTPHADRKEVGTATQRVVEGANGVPFVGRRRR